MNDGSQIGLDRDTEVDYLGATTIGELIVAADRMFLSGRGSFSRLSQYLNGINNGRGIGPVCQ